MLARWVNAACAGKGRASVRDHVPDADESVRCDSGPHEPDMCERADAVASVTKS
jgi:hypothetical protein